MSVILSIKPKYVEEIVNGNKKFEFRKIVFKKYSKGDDIFIYSTSPVKKIIGKFRSNEIIAEHPEVLWDQLKDDSGLDRKEFFDYFQNREHGFAIGIDDLEIFKIPIEPTSMIPNFVPPQSFQYLDNSSFLVENSLTPISSR